MDTIDAMVILKVNNSQQKYAKWFDLAVQHSCWTIKEFK